MAWVYQRKNCPLFLMSFTVGMSPEVKKKEMD